MDLWKILLLGAVVVGLILLFQMGSRPVAVPEPLPGSLVEQGTFAIEQAGQRVGEEAFTVWLVEAGFRVDSEVRLTGVELAAELLLSPDWTPLSYTLVVQTPHGKQHLAARIAGEEVTFEAVVGLVRQDRELTETPPFAVLDNNVIGHWHALYRFLRAAGRTGEMQGTALIPQAFAALPFRAQPPEPVGLKVGERTLPAERYRVQLADQEVWLYGQGELLLGAVFPTQLALAYLEEVLPDGLIVVEPVPSP
ncbi:MAG: hypothetical protein NUV94_06775 [Candidatus Acetothermia bacterium]|jgi:hypothetical protein|nr:hypothetical protein [Candidatus Acetothermia bacterium]